MENAYDNINMYDIAKIKMYRSDKIRMYNLAFTTWLSGEKRG